MASSVLIDKADERSREAIEGFDLAASLTAASDLSRAADLIDYTVGRLSRRTSHASSCTDLSISSFLTSLQASAALFKATAMKILRWRNQWLDKEVDELDAVEKALCGGVRMCGAEELGLESILSSLELLVVLYASCDTHVRHSCVVDMVFHGAADVMSSIQSRVQTEVHPPNTQHALTTGRFARPIQGTETPINTLCITCRDEGGDAVACLEPEDVVVSSGPHTSILGVSVGVDGVEVVFTVTVEGGSSILFSSMVGGTELPVITVPVATMIAGKLVQSVTLPPRANGKCTCSGVAISPDGRFCAVSSMESSLVTYTMPDFTTVHEWEEGRGPGQVKAPWKLCFTPGGNLLVVEDGNSRVQELLVTGEHVRFVGLGILGPDVRGIDANEETIAVSYGYSSTDLTLALFSAVNGSHVRSCSLYDDAETSLSCCYSVRLIQAGRGVLITDFGRDMVFEFTLGGTFVRLAAGDPLRSPQDSVMCLNGEVIVADKELKCLCVFGPTGVEVRSFSPDGAFSPAALALHDGRLFVVETNSTVLRVYE